METKSFVIGAVVGAAAALTLGKIIGSMGEEVTLGLPEEPEGRRPIPDLPSHHGPVHEEHSPWGDIAGTVLRSAVEGFMKQGAQR